MKVFELTARHTAQLVLLCCFVCLGSLSLHAQGFVFNNFSSTAGLRINRSAGFTTGVATDAQVLRLTPASTFQVGSAWYCGSACDTTGTLLPLANGFSTTFKFQLSSPGGIGPADGFAFVIQNGCFVNDPTTCGILAVDPIVGGSIGFSGNVVCTGLGGAPPCTDQNQGLTHSLAVEFDTYHNAFDISANEVGVQSCGNLANTADHTNTSCNLGLVDPSTFNPPITLSDGNVHTATITYTPPVACNDTCPTNLTVTLDNKIVLSVRVDLGTLVLDSSDDAYVGFTASTGAGDENQDILSWSFDPAQTANLSPTGGSFNLSWENGTYTFGATYPAGMFPANSKVRVIPKETTQPEWKLRTPEGNPYNGTFIAPVRKNGNGSGIIFSADCIMLSDGSPCPGPSTPLSYNVNTTWQSSQLGHCSSGPGLLSADSDNTWVNTLIKCTQISPDPVYGTGGTKKCITGTKCLSEWPNVFGIPGPIASLSPSNVAFGDVPRFGFRIKSITVTNIGSSDLSISSVKVTGGSDDFLALSLCFEPLGPQESCTIFVAFFADFDQFGLLQSDTLTFTDNAKTDSGSSPHEVSVLLTAKVVAR
jgi:Legume lectin domain